ncbi:hypothetical protein ACTA71_011302 [Dictyostelium dimigraforme]
MKYINYIFLFLIILNLNNFVLSGFDCNQSINVQIENSCGGNNPSRLNIFNTLYYFDSIGISPFVEPFFDVNRGIYSWYLVDGINYTLSYKYKGCQNYNSQSFISKGMYYKLLSEPLCPKTYFTYTVYNWALDTNLNFTGIPSTFSIANQNGGCSLNFFVAPLSTSKGVFESGAANYSNPTCGFKNGTISIDLTKGYSNVHLYFDTDTSLSNEIQPTSPGHYTGLDSFGYYLFVDSLECGTERVPISMSNVYPPLEITFESVQQGGGNSTISYSLAGGNNGILNDTNSFGYLLGFGDSLPLTDWVHKNVEFDYRFMYGYHYFQDFSNVDNPGKLQCSFQELLALKYYSPNINLTISRNSSCLGNVTFTIYPSSSLLPQNILFYDYDDEESEIPFPMVNNRVSVQYNKNLLIQEQLTGTSLIYSTVFQVLSYSIVQAFDRPGCWKTYNIIIVNYQLYRNLTLKIYGDDQVTTFYPINGVFENVPANYYYVHYVAGDCETESFILINTFDDITPMDDVTVDIKTLSVGSCTDQTLFQVTVDTIFGTYSKNYSTYNSMDFDFYFPTCSCVVRGTYSSPPLVDDDPFTYEMISNLNCNSTGNIIQFFSSNSNYNSIFQVFSNNVQLSPNFDNNLSDAFNIGPGENNVTITYTNSIGTCYRSQTITIQSTFETPLIQVSPVTNCQSPDGKIEISNYQDFQSLEIIIDSNIQTINSGIIEYLSSGLYFLTYSYNQTCSNTITVYIPTSEDNIIITTSIISNPTCNNQLIADGKINVTLNVDGIQINNFQISNQNNNNFLNGVYSIANPGLNSLTIKYGSCSWNRNVNTFLNRPTFTLERVYNDTCLTTSYYKLINSNPNVVIDNMDSTFSTIIYQKDYYIQVTGDGTYDYSLSWNSICTDSFSQIITSTNLNSKDSNYLDYEIIKADNCSSLKVDILIKNMNIFKSVTQTWKYPVKINSTHSIFKNLSPANSYEIYFTLLNGCNIYQTVGYNQLSSGNTKETLNIIKTNDLCYSGKGSIQLLNLDFNNYYYQIKNLNGIQSVTPIQNGTTIFSNLYPGTYNVTRYCKTMENCYLQTKITIENDNPIIESIQVIDSYDQLNNGSVEIKLNFISAYPIIYRILGTNLLNQDGKFSNLSPNTYEIQVELNDRMCPITIKQSFTIKSITPPPTSSPPPTSLPPKSSDELSTTSFIQFNHLLITILILLLIIF